MYIYMEYQQGSLVTFGSVCWLSGWSVECLQVVWFCLWSVCRLCGFVYGVSAGWVVVLWSVCRLSGCSMECLQVGWLFCGVSAG